MTEETHKEALDLIENVRKYNRRAEQLEALVGAIRQQTKDEVGLDLYMNGQSFRFHVSPRRLAEFLDEEHAIAQQRERRYKAKFDAL